MSRLGWILVPVLLLVAWRGLAGRVSGRRLAWDPDVTPVVAVITLPGAWAPLDRYERFELPIGLAFEELGLGELTEGETLDDGSGRLVLEIADARRTIPVVLDVLRAAGAPPDTVVAWTTPEGAREERVGNCA